MIIFFTGKCHIMISCCVATNMTHIVDSVLYFLMLFMERL